MDFMEASERALDQAIELAKPHASSLVVCHILEPGTDQAGVKEKIKPFIDRIETAGLNAELLIEVGDLFDAASAAAKKVQPDLVVAGTRGIEGFDMRLHGSAIYKFVRDVGYTSLIVHPESKVSEGGYQKVMLPVSPHDNFMKKVSETVKILADEGEIIVFSLVKKGEALDEKLQKHKKDAESFLNEKGFKWQYVDHETTKVGQAFASETLEKYKDLNMDLITIAADLSRQNRHFGKMHKEDVLLNRSGIPVLCVNTDFD